MNLSNRTKQFCGHRFKINVNVHLNLSLFLGCFLIRRMSVILIKMSFNLMTCAMNNLSWIFRLYPFIVITLGYIWWYNYFNAKHCSSPAASERHAFYFWADVPHVAHTGSNVSLWYGEKWNLVEDNFSTRWSWRGRLCGRDKDVLQEHQSAEDRVISINNFPEWQMRQGRERRFTECMHVEA